MLNSQDSSLSLRSDGMHPELRYDDAGNAFVRVVNGLWAPHCGFAVPLPHPSRAPTSAPVVPVLEIMEYFISLAYGLIGRTDYFIILFFKVRFILFRWIIAHGKSPSIEYVPFSAPGAQVPKIGHCSLVGLAYSLCMMDALFHDLGIALGVPVCHIKLIFCLLFAYPLGSLFTRIPSSQSSLKHAFNILVSAFFLISILHLWWGFLQLLGSSLATYFIAANVRGPRMPWTVFIIVMGHLTFNHIVRVVYGLGRETIEITSPQMVLTMKLTTFAWSVYDGRRLEKDLDKWQLQKRIMKYPTLLEFLGFSFYFPGVLVGPYLDYTSYASLIDGSLFVLGKSKEPTHGVIPRGRKRVAYRKMLLGLVYLGVFVVLGPSYNYTIALTPWFAQRSILHRIGVTQIYGAVDRCKFYGIWTLTEGASILTGLGFTGYGRSGESLWEGATNIKMLDVEFAPNFKVLLDSWNINTNIWLRECVYKRVTPQGKKPGFRSILITSATSAFWHGTEMGFYLAFIFGTFITYTARKCRANFRPLVLPPPGMPTTWVKVSYDILGTFICILLLNFTMAPFSLLTVADSIEAWSRLGWYGCWIVGSGIVFFNAGGSKCLQGLQKKQVDGTKSNSSLDVPATPLAGVVGVETRNARAQMYT